MQPSPAMESALARNRTALAALGCWLGFAALAVAAQTGALAQLDAAGLRLWRGGPDLAAIGPDWLTRFMLGATYLGDAALRFTPLALAAALLAWRRRWQRIALLGAAALPAGAINSAMKGWFGRPRPDFLPHLAPAGGLSFPSGHAFGAATAYLALALVLAPGARRGDAALLGAALALAGLVAFTRVWLGVHYPKIGRASCRERV